MQRRHHTWQSLLSAMILALGFWFLWVCVAGFAGDSIESGWRRSWPYEYLSVHADGSVRIKQYTDGGRTTFFDVDGNPMPTPEAEQLTQTWLSAQPRRDDLGMGWYHRLYPLSDGQPVPTYWYCLAETAPAVGAYFVGYDSETSRRVGYLGTQGFRPELPPPAEWFPIDVRRRSLRSAITSAPGQYHYASRYPSAVFANPPADAIPGWVAFVLADDTVYEVDLRAHTTRLIRTEPESPPVAVGFVAHPTAGATMARALAVRTADRVLIRGPNGETLRSWPIPADLRDTDLIWYELPHGQALVNRIRPADAGTNVQHHILDWVDASGRFDRHAELDVQWSAPPMLGRYEQSLYALYMPMPWLMVLVMLVVRSATAAGGAPSGELPPLSSTLAATWPGLLALVVVSGILTWLCVRRQARYAESGWVWPVFVFLWGLPGWVGYRFGRHWPALERCADCGRPAPVNHAACQRCDTPLPTPAPRDVEIFA